MTNNLEKLQEEQEENRHGGHFSKVFLNNIILIIIIIGLVLTTILPNNKIKEIEGKIVSINSEFVSVKTDSNKTMKIYYADSVTEHTSFSLSNGVSFTIEDIKANSYFLQNYINDEVYIEYKDVNVLIFFNTKKIASKVEILSY